MLSFLIRQFAEATFYSVSTWKVNESSESISRPRNLALGTSSSLVPLIVKVISSLIFEGRHLPVMTIALVLPSLTGILFEAAQPTISAIDEFRVTL